MSRYLKLCKTQNGYRIYTCKHSLNQQTIFQTSYFTQISSTQHKIFMQPDMDIRMLGQIESPGAYLSEKQKMAPSFYHATRTFENFEAILTSGVIQARQQKGFYGAYVSTKHEKNYGNFVFILNGELINHGFLYTMTKDDPQSLWAGFGKNIPLKKYLVGVAYTGHQKPAGFEESIGKVEKAWGRKITIETKPINPGEKFIPFFWPRSIDSKRLFVLNYVIENKDHRMIMTWSAHDAHEKNYYHTTIKYRPSSPNRSLDEYKSSLGQRAMAILADAHKKEEDGTRKKDIEAAAKRFMVWEATTTYPPFQALLGRLNKAIGRFHAQYKKYLKRKKSQDKTTWMDKIVGLYFVKDLDLKAVDAFYQTMEKNDKIALLMYLKSKTAFWQYKVDASPTPRSTRQHEVYTKLTLRSIFDILSHLEQEVRDRDRTSHVEEKGQRKKIFSRLSWWFKTVLTLISQNKKLGIKIHQELNRFVSEQMSSQTKSELMDLWQQAFAAKLPVDFETFKLFGGCDKASNHLRWVLEAYPEEKPSESQNHIIAQILRGDGDTPLLIQSIKANDTAMVEFLMHPNFQEKIKHRDWFLLYSQVHPNFCENKGASASHWAVSCDNIAALQSMLNAHKFLDINRKANGSTMLEKAIRCQKIDIIKYLIEKGGNLGNTTAKNLQSHIGNMSVAQKKQILACWKKAFEAKLPVDFETFKLFAGQGLGAHSLPIIGALLLKKPFIRKVVAYTGGRFSKANDRPLWYITGLLALLGVMLIAGTTSVPWITAILPFYAQILLCCVGGILCLGLIMLTIRCLYHTINQDAFAQHEGQAILQACQPDTIGPPESPAMATVQEDRKDAKEYAGERCDIDLKHTQL